MEYSFRHSIPGRVRLHIPDLCRKPAFAETFLGWLRGQSGVRSARINYDCASLVLEYEPAQEPLLLALLQRVKTMALAEMKAFISCGHHADTAATGRRNSEAIAAGTADIVADDGVQHQSGGEGNQHALDALECDPDCQTCLQGLGR